MPMDSMDITKLPLEVRAKLAELDLEIAEGDITQKGYDKKRTRLLEPYLNTSRSAPHVQSKPKHESSKSKSVKPKNSFSNGKKPSNTVEMPSNTSNVNLFRSDTHSEAVQLALAQHKSKRVPVLLMPIKRNTLATQKEINTSTELKSPEITRVSQDNEPKIQESSSSLPTTPNQPSYPPQIRSQYKPKVSPSFHSELRGALQGNGKTRTSIGDSNRSKGPDLIQRKADSMPREITGFQSLSQSQPDVTNVFPNKSFISSPITSSGSLTQLSNSPVTPHSSSSSVSEAISDDIAVTKVSAKIQQLLLTLKRPKKKALVEFYQDDQDELLGNIVKDENAPKPEGVVTAPREGNPLQSLPNIPSSIEAAIHRYGTANPKGACLTSLDQSGKPSYTLTYGKLLSRMRKVAYTLTNKRNNLKPGQRVALVFPNPEPVSFACVFHGCLLAGLIPVVVEVPQSSEDPGSSQLGFLLGSCAVSVALSTEQCLKLLPKNEKGDVIHLKGWPRLQWIITDPRHLNKPPNNWEPLIHDISEQLAYIEYKTGKEGSVVGVAHNRSTIHQHCRTLMGSLSYNAGDIMINLLDFRRGFGLVHGIIASIYSGMHVVCVPYSLTKHNPAHWLQITTKHKASLALVKSRDLHWTLAVQRENPNINLQTLRMVIVADGANPWSVASCDLFVSEFSKRGLNRDAICPCAWSTEALTVAVKRPGIASLRTALSLNHLSYSVVQEEQPASQVPSIVLQDCGKILPGCIAAVVKAEGEPLLCKADEIGEILICNNLDNDSSYYGLTGLTEKIFKANPIDESGNLRITTASYTRTGLLGYLNPSGRVFVTGHVVDTLNISGRVHNSNDLIATVLAVEPTRFIHKSRVVVFSINLLKDERLVVVAEQKPDSSEELCFKWMGNVVQVLEGIHNIAAYCVVLLPPNGLPRTPLGVIHLSETKSRFLEGSLQPRHTMMCPHQCVTNLPKPRKKLKDIGAASFLQGQVVTGKKMAEAIGKELKSGESGNDPAINFSCLSEILKWRAQSSPEHILFALIGAKGSVSSQFTCAQLHKKAEKIAQLLMSHSSHHGTFISTGDNVALIFPPGLELVAAFYGCLYAGCVPVPIRPPHPRSVGATMPTVKMIAKASKAVCILSTSSIMKLLRSKEAIAALQNTNSNTAWPPIMDVDDTPKKKVPINYKPPTAEMLAYLDFSVTNSGTLVGIKMSHNACCLLGRSIKSQCELSPLRAVALCLDPYSGLGLALWCLSSVYSGHQSFLIPPNELESNSQLWLNAVHQHKIRSVHLSYGVVELATKDLAANVASLKNRNVSLRHVQTCTIVAEERPRLMLTNNFVKFYQGLGLSPQAVSTSFGCRVGVAIGLQGPASQEPAAVYVDMKALRNERVSLVERGSPHSLCLLESGKVLPGTKVILADPESSVQCSYSQLGEIWVASPFAPQGYYMVHGGDANLSYQNHFQAKLTTGDTSTKYARTGFLGFLKKADRTSSSGAESSDSLYVIGSLEETIEVTGMNFHPIDIENSVVRCSGKIAECVVFQSTNFLVVIVELDGPETSALDLVPLVTNVVLEEHYIIAGVVAVTDLGSITFNSRGEKQRMHLRDAFLHDRLDPIYVAYNM